MTRTVIHHRGAGDDSIALYSGKQLMQKFDISEMDGDQRSEAMALSIQWANQPRPVTPAHTVSRRKHRILDDVRMSERVKDYAAQMTEVQRTRRQRQLEIRAEAKRRADEELEVQRRQREKAQRDGDPQ